MCNNSVVSQLFYGILRFITSFTRALHQVINDRETLYRFRKTEVDMLIGITTGYGLDDLPTEMQF
jgi:hypothetical protein